MYNWVDDVRQANDDVVRRSISGSQETDDVIDDVIVR